MKRVLKKILIVMSVILVWGGILSAPIIVSAEEPQYAECGVSEPKLNYVYLENDCIICSENQNIVISYGDEETKISKAVLTIINIETETVRKIDMDCSYAETALFSIDFTPEDCGNYQVTDIWILTQDGKEDTISLSSIGINEVIFGVNEDMSTESAEMSIVTLNADSGYITDADICQINNAFEVNNTGFLSSSHMMTESEDVVVFLDPGHDSTHAGAQKNGLAEEVLNLKIAQYCKEELESYYGVKVYMSRSGSGCPYPGTSSVKDNLNRVLAAASVGADAYVSIHLNSASKSTVNGAEVFYPNSNYRPDLGSAGANLATQVERRLVELGLKNRGISIRNSGDGTQYPDNSLADYYGVIKNSKLCGFPGIIIEHAYVSGSSDAVFLKNESNLRALGIADATGIARYFDLSKEKPHKEADRTKVEAFVTRLYQKCLSRNPDTEGLNYWTDGICDFTINGAQTAAYFIFSPELTAKKLSNESYVEILYSSFLDRPSDAAGKKYWVNALDNGVSRYGIFMGFVNSDEFTRICDLYGIEKGNAGPQEGRDYNLGLTMFMNRLYTKALERQYDLDGLNYWCTEVYKGNISIYEVSTTGFFHSKEFLSKNLSNDEYVKVLYRTFLDREYDKPGYDYWMKRLKTGSSRDEILNEFANSEEFSGIKKYYGLNAK